MFRRSSKFMMVENDYPEKLYHRRVSDRPYHVKVEIPSTEKVTFVEYDPHLTPVKALGVALGTSRTPSVITGERKK
ncbi:hypothetical protein EVAR_70140_1 [Eumeta japonica]|uniref:Uncharacterized protein n=1 Tax=Eumeta variegata TaxID=151549 RepID=A0A4C1Z8V6_EUMVA|nr:hypothetical protein EVAR_70140_1 [Eumeta japonica]